MADPLVVPMLAYEDGVAALEWLARVFGFVEKRRLLADGRLTHGELQTPGGGLIMLATPTPRYRSPRHHREECALARACYDDVPYVIDGVLVQVDDVERHYVRAVAAGARILTPLEDGPPGRRYRCEDLEGHRWMFVQPA
jgi:PhnB protein